MAQQWFYAKQGKQLGPVPVEQLQKAIANGEVQLTELVWTEGMPQWTPAGHVKELTGGVPRAAGPATPPSPPAVAKPRKAEPAGPPQTAPAGAASTAGPAAAAPAGPGGGSGGGPLGLFDLHFKHFFTPSLVKLLWLLYLIVAVLWFLIDAGIVAAGVVFHKAPLWEPLKSIALNLVQLCFMTLAVRLALEGVLVLFRIAEHLREIRDRGAEDGPARK